MPPVFRAQAVYTVVPAPAPNTPEVSSQARPEAGNDPWQGYALLKRICSVESNYDATGSDPMQFLPDGMPNWGWQDGKMVKRDVGACQINTWAHAGEIAALHLDVVQSKDDNITYAKILFDREGWRPWIASKPHWDPQNIIN